MRFDATTLHDNSHLVRVFMDEGQSYDRMIVVTVSGDTLFLQGWVGKPLTPAQWRHAARELFPNAKRVQFERRGPRGIRQVELTL